MVKSQILELLRPVAAVGFLPQVEAVSAAIRTGARESPLMPLAETVATMGLMDDIRHQLGVRYACVGEC